MKLLVKITAILLCIIGLSGCEFTPTDISDLINPPKLSAEQQAIQKAIGQSIGATNFKLKYPLDGNYRSPIINMVSGKDPYAIALYTPNTDNAGTHIMVLKKTNDKWEEVRDISGDGNEIERIDFGDFDGNGTFDLVVGWTLFSSTDIGLRVYSINSNGPAKLYSDSFTDMTITDLDKDGKDDILLLKLDPASKLAAARMVSYRDGRLKEVADAPLDSTVSSYGGMYPLNISKKSGGVYIDGYKGANYMITELVLWKDGKIITPFYNSVKKTVSSTFRELPLRCADIDKDNNYEVPVPVEMPGYENKPYDNKIWMVRWCTYDEKQGLVPKFNCVINNSDGYYLMMPKAWIKKVTVQNVPYERKWVFMEWNNNKAGRVLFDIKVFSVKDWKALNNKSEYIELLTSNGLVYTAKPGQKLGGNDPLYMSPEEIVNSFKLI